jgi:hypothetical protein
MQAYHSVHDDTYVRTYGEIFIQYYDVAVVDKLDPWSMLRPAPIDDDGDGGGMDHRSIILV